MVDRHLPPGTPAALTALVIALDDCGVLPKEHYISALRRVWTQLPEDPSFDDEARACQQLLDCLG